MSNVFVVCMGIGTVFVGLLSIVILCSVMGVICRAAEKKSGSAGSAAAVQAVAAQPIENRQEIIAAVAAAAAEEMGTEPSAIRILSFKKL